MKRYYGSKKAYVHAIYPVQNPNLSIYLSPIMHESANPVCIESCRIIIRKKVFISNFVLLHWCGPRKLIHMLFGIHMSAHQRSPRTLNSDVKHLTRRHSVTNAFVCTRTVGSATLQHWLLTQDIPLTPLLDLLPAEHNIGSAKRGNAATT